ncbi:MAG: imidazolonepropionase [Acidobacteriales bacterium]|nr:imidazolonepropionase [Candidatus Koribacter versatilis]MBI3645149.1 imidazolonepropionase [Terriglobales bacterium]
MPKLAGLLLVNIGQLLTLRAPVTGLRRSASLSEIGIIEDAAVLCVGGKIVSLGTTKEALRDPWLKKNRKKITEIDCGGRVVLPGFVDSHTHPVFTQPRLVDFEKRIAGAGYEEIAEAGGGIRSSIDGVRRASKAALAGKVLGALRDLAKHGTTTVEAKSGYGLSLESELKSLEAIRAAAKQWPGTVVPTFLGAHVVPPEYRGRSREYVEIVCKEMMPAVAKGKLAGFVDVFCDRGAFSAEETAHIFGAAAESGLGIRAHMGQLSETRIEPFLQFRPTSLDHMDNVNEADLPALAASDTVATLVPGANYFLGLSQYPDARRLIAAGVAVALATDYNPGTSPTISMPMAMSLACTHMKMSPAEAIAAATINGAWALRLADRKGSVEPGKDADLAVFDVEDYREIPYWFGVNRCVQTIIGGVAGC